MTYLFKDTDLAAHRLRVLAEVFEPASEAFLREVVHETPELALDLGCGPGCTTRLLASITGSQRTVGLDASASFLELAAENAPASLAFMQHDLTRVPFPTGAGDLLFCRMLLTHLRNPLEVIADWSTQLRPGGLLLLDEVEWIETGHPTLRAYLQIVAAMLAGQANQLYIGPTLDEYRPAEPLQRVLSRIYPLPVSTRQAALMFSMNIPAWKNQSFIQAHYPAQTIEKLEQELLELAERATGEDEIVWGMRQVAFKKS